MEREREKYWQLEEQRKKASVVRESDSSAKARATASEGRANFSTTEISGALAISARATFLFTSSCSCSCSCARLTQRGARERFARESQRVGKSTFGVFIQFQFGARLLACDWHGNSISDGLLRDASVLSICMRWPCAVLPAPGHVRMQCNKRYCATSRSTAVGVQTLTPCDARLRTAAPRQTCEQQLDCNADLT